MARQRFVHPDIWADPTLGKLTPTERLFFIGCFSNADDEGRLLGNPAYLRATIFPYDDLSLEEVKDIRDHVVAVCKNVILYEVEGLEYLAFLKWDTYQKPKYPKPSKLPPPPKNKQEVQKGNTEVNIGETFPQNGEMLEKDLLPRLGLDRDGFGMGLGWDGEPSQGSVPPAANQPALPGHTETERELLKELKSVPGYPFDFPKDLEYIRSLSVEFPGLNLLAEVQKWRVYKLDKPLAKKSNPRLQLRNWCEIAVKRQKEHQQASPRAEPSKPEPKSWATLRRVADKLQGGVDIFDT